MVKLYAFLWHVNVEVMKASEGGGGSCCESASCERKTEKEAYALLNTWLKQRKSVCRDRKCEHTPVVTDKLTPKMIMSGMAVNMVKI